MCHGFHTSKSRSKLQTAGVLWWVYTFALPGSPEQGRSSPGRIIITREKAKARARAKGLTCAPAPEYAMHLQIQGVGRTKKNSDGASSNM